MSAPPNQQPLPPHPPLTHQNDTTEPPLHQRSLPNHGEGDGAEVGSLVEHGLSDAGVSHSRADSDMDIEDEIAYIDEAKISEPVDGLNQNSVMIPNELEMKELLPGLQNVAERSPSQDSISRNILDSGPSEFLEQIKGDNPFPDCDHFCFGGSLTGVDTSVMNQIGALNNAEGYVDQFSTCPNVALSQPKPSVLSQPENVYGQLNPVESQSVSSQPVRGANPFRLLRDSTSDDGSQSVLEPSPEKVGIVSVRPSVKSVAVHLDGEMSYHIRTDGTAKNVDRASTVKTEQPEDNNTYGIKKSTNTGTSEMDFQAKVHNGGGVSSASRSSKYQKDDEKHVPSQHKVDEFGRLVRERASDSDSEELQYSRMRGKRGQSRTRSRSPHDRRRRSPVRRRERRSRSRSWSPKKRRSRSRSPLRRGDEYGIDKTRRDRGQHRQYCMDYKRGKCYRGSSCRYMHDSNRGDDSSRSYRSKYQEVPPSPRKNVEKPDHKHYDKKESLISEINVSDKDVESLITSVAESVRTREVTSQSQETKSNKKELVADAGGKLSPADISVVQQSQANLFDPKSLDQLQPSHIDGPSASDSTPLQASEAIQNPHQHIGIADLYPNNPHQQSQLPPPPLPRAPPRPPIAQPANPPFYPYQAPLTHQHTHLSGPPLNPPWNSLQPPSLQFQQNQTPSWNNNYPPPHMLVNPYPTVQHNSHLQAGESHHGTHLPLQNPYRSFPQTEHTGPSMFPVSTMTQPHVGPNSSSAQSHMHLPSYGLQQPTAGSVSNYQNPFASPFEQPESSKISSNDFNQTDSMKYDPISDSIDNGQKLDGSNKPQDLLIESTKPREFGAVALSTLENDEYGENAEPEVGAVENGSPSDPIDEALEIDQVKSPGKSNKEGKDSRSMKLFKVALADFVKEVLKPSWRQGNMSKEAFKTIVKKTVDKVAGAMKSHQVPKSQAKINQYIDSSQRKLTKLVMGYVEKYVKV